MKLFIFRTFCLIIFNAFQFGVGESSNLDCLKVDNCSSCIQIVNCAWCLDETFDSITGRKCDSYDTLIRDDCKLIYNPMSTIQVIEALDQESTDGSVDSKILTESNSITSSKDAFMDLILKDAKKNSKKRDTFQQGDKLVQLKPDKIKLKIKPNTKIRFNLTFEQAEKYPLDIYYLMDLTYSMKDHRDALVKLADKISESMIDITTKFRLGFGSFVDKVVMPYSNMLPEKLKNPCNQNIPCRPAYGYRNHLSLTNDSKLFLERIKEAELSGNLDNAEGGFDALMQVINCKKEINWNYPSRKIILFATDSLFHYSGDGKLGGIVKPNDNSCHLDKDGYYTETLNQDYPSLEQINKAIVNNQINIIFSVPDNQLKLYEILSENLEGAIAGKLAENSSNIVDLIRENYKKIVSTIELKDDASKSIEIKYFSRCTSTNSSLKQTNLCKDVGVGQKVQFEVELAVKSCKELKKEKFSIFPIGIEEKTEIELELICECDCEANAESKSERCSSTGTLRCGVCECDSNSFGDHCQCSQNSLTGLSSNEECISNSRNESNVVCSNKGTCMCGRCLCDDKSRDDLLIYGKYCQCDDYSCPKNNGETCSGRGRCCDKKCECISGWTGESCECSLDESTCVSPINGKICSGNGECQCGKCLCKRAQSEIWTGRYCNECPTCNEECSAYDPCVLCKAFNTGPYSSNCEENCNFNMKIVKRFSYLAGNQFDNAQINASNQSNELEQTMSISDRNMIKNELNTPSLIKRCIMIDENNCKYEFIYTFETSTEQIYIEILDDKMCPNVQNILYFMFFIAMIIILIGLLALICWRIYASYQDRKACKEWMEYLKTRKFTSTGQNPLYKAPQSEFKNPLYGKTEND